MRLKNFLCAGVALALVPLVVTPSQALELRMLNILDNRYPGTVGMAEAYVERIENASNGEITVTTSGPETVSPYEQLQPVQAGVFDLHFTYPAFHGNVTTMAVGLESVAPEPDKIRESGIWDFVDQHYQKLGLKLLSLPMSHGIHFVLREPIDPAVGDLTGLKIRGNPQTRAYIEALGASMVVVPPGEIYSALQNGVIDGASYPILGALNFKWYEVAGYFARPWFGSLPHLILVNLDSWNELPPEQQQMMLEQGRELEHEVRDTFNRWGQEEEQALREQDMQETDFSPEAQARLFEAFRENAWSYAASRDPEDAAELRKLAEDAGLVVDDWQAWREQNID